MRKRCLAKETNRFLHLLRMHLPSLAKSPELEWLEGAKYMKNHFPSDT